MQWVAILLSITAGALASEYPCTLSSGVLDCSAKDLILPPPGYWPNIYHLNLNNNPIIEFPKNCFSGFPNVLSLTAQYILVEELDFGVLSDMSNLVTLNLQDSNFKIITSATEDLSLSNLRYIYLYGNKISTLDPNVFAVNAPALSILSINDNPIILEPGKSVINHPNLESLWVGMHRNIGALDSTLLSGLPNLKFISLSYANITDINEPFVNNKLLENIYLTENSITEITSNSFPSYGIIERIMLDENPLERLPAAAVDKAMASGGALRIEGTPLACECAYEALFWWAESKEITLEAECSGVQLCSFTRLRSASPFKVPSTLQDIHHERDVLGKYVPEN